MTARGFNPQRRSMERTIQLRLSAEEHEELKRLANWFDCSVSDIIRHGVGLAREDLGETVAERDAERPERMDELVRDWPVPDRQDYLDELMKMYPSLRRGSERELDFQAMMWAHVNLWAEDFRSRVEELVAEKTSGATARGLETEKTE